MRIHGIHVQGMRAPSGEHRLHLDPGYNVVLTRDEPAGTGLAALLSAFLYPRTDLGDLEIWRDPNARQPSRAGLVLSLGPYVFRLIVDLDKQRLVLGRHDAASDRYERVATDPAEIETVLRGAGLPSREEFMTLQMCQGSALRLVQPQPEPPAPEARPAPVAVPELGPERARLLQELKRAETARRERAALERRVAELRQARDRLALLERDHQKLLAEVEAQAVPGIDDLDTQLDRLKEVEAELARERLNIERSRRELIDERTALRRIPVRQTFPLWLGVALAVLGSLAGFAGHALFYVFGPLGIATVVGALFVSRNARRRMGTVEACLAALRVRERAVERDFESQSAPLRELMQTLGVDSLEEVAERASKQRELAARANKLEQELSELRQVLPEKAEEELRQLGAELAAMADLSDPDEIRDKLTRLSDVDSGTSVPAAAAPARAGWSGPDQLIRAAALTLGRSEAEVTDRLAPMLPVYLRALSLGRFTQVGRRDFEGWLLREQTGGEVMRYDRLSESKRFEVELAFRLAILEAIAPDLCIPLVLGPTLPLDQEEGRLALARALHRLGSAVQVLHIAVGGGAWIEHANCSQVM